MIMMYKPFYTIITRKQEHFLFFFFCRIKYGKLNRKKKILKIYSNFDADKIKRKENFPVYWKRKK